MVVIKLTLEALTLALIRRSSQLSLSMLVSTRFGNLLDKCLFIVILAVQTLAHFRVANPSILVTFTVAFLALRVLATAALFS